MIRDYVRDSGNVINVYLTSNGSGDAYLESNFTLYKSSYQNKLLDVYVPKSLLFNDKDGIFNYAVSIGALMRAENGSQVTTDAYYMSYLKTISVKDPQTQELVEYAVFERLLPKEFVVYAGTTQMLINILNIDSTKNNVLSIVTTQITNLTVQESAYVSQEEELEPTELQNIEARLTKTERDIDYILTDFANGEYYVTSISGNSLPTTEELTNIVNTIEGREPKNGDTIIFTNLNDGIVYKYIYTAREWERYQIPNIQDASNDVLGVVKGTYNTNDNEVTTTEFNIRSGKILNVYILNNGIKKELADILNEDIPNTYLTKEAGVSKQYVRDYALPREFNDVYYISSDGYTKTLPSGDVQFSNISSGLSEIVLFDIKFKQTATYQLSDKNSCINNLWISADRDSNFQVRLTTYAKETENASWETLSIELSDLVSVNQNDLRKVVLNSNFNSLTKVLTITEESYIRQVLEIIPQESSITVFSLYSNEVYNSSFNLNTQSLVVSVQTGKMGEQKNIVAQGNLENNTVTYTFNEELDNNTEILLTLFSSFLIREDYNLVLSDGIQNIQLTTPYGQATFSDLKQVFVRETSSTTRYDMKCFVMNDGANIQLLIDMDNLSSIKQELENGDIISGVAKDFASEGTIGETFEYQNNAILNLIKGQYLSGGYNIDLSKQESGVVITSTKEYIIINQPETATNGILTSEQIALLQANKDAYIVFANENYYLNGNGHNEGYITYTNIEYENNQTIIKNITITINTLSWVLNEQTVGLSSNPNLLINGDFRIRTANNSPDMWIIGGSSTVQLDEVGITITTSGTASFIQEIKVPFELFSGKVLTLSAKMNGKIYSANATIPNEKPTATTGETAYINFNIAENNINGWLKFVWHNVDKNYRAYFYFSNAQTVKFDYVKLEIGTVATTYAPNFTESYLIKNIPSNPNLLINGDFGVNQRGKTSYTGTNSVSYTVDRWALYWSEGFSYDVSTKTITATSNGSIIQYMEDSKNLLGKTLTLSCKVNDVLYSKTATLNSSYNANTYVIDFDIGNTGFKLQLYWHNELSIFRVMIATNSAPASISVDYVKLEIGSVATPFSPRPYAEELALCQRYFQALKGNLKYITFADGGCTGKTTTDGVTTYNFWFNLPYTVPMRTNPSVSLKSTLTILCKGVYKSGITLEGANYSLGHTTNYKPIIFKPELSIDALGCFATLRSDDANENAPAEIYLDAEIY